MTKKKAREKLSIFLYIHVCIQKANHPLQKHSFSTIDYLLMFITTPFLIAFIVACVWMSVNKKGNHSDATSYFSKDFAYATIFCK